jgi:hypothetical protein
MNTSVKSGATFLEPTFKRAALIWWAWLWRSVLLGIAGSAFISLVLGISGVLSRTDETSRIVVMALAVAISAPLGIWVFQMLLEKKFREFTIRLVPTVRPESNQNSLGVSADPPEL